MVAAGAARVGCFALVARDSVTILMEDEGGTNTYLLSAGVLGRRVLLVSLAGRVSLLADGRRGSEVDLRTGAVDAGLPVSESSREGATGSLCLSVKVHSEVR